MLTFTALLLLLAALPDLLHRQGQPVVPLGRLVRAGSDGAAPRSDPSLRPLALLQAGLLQRLQDADRTWIPRAEPLPDGGIRYLYKRRAGDPELTIPQIKALMARPPSHAEDRQAIVALLTALDRVGASVDLIEPIKTGAAAEWDPQARLLRIRPDVPDQGSVEFLRVLNHEAIHVAQSCAAGGVGANPQPLGLALASSDAVAAGRDSTARQIVAHPLDDPVYADLSPRERRMEQEAYSLQNRVGIGTALLRIHCLNGRPGV